MDIGAVILPAFWIHFVYSVLDIGKKRKKEIYSYYFFGFFLIVLNIADYFYHGIFTKEVVLNPIFNYYPSAGPGYYLFVLFYIIVVPFSFYQLIRGYSKSIGFKSEQIRYFMVASFLGFGGGVTAFLFTFNIQVPPYGIVLFAFYPVIIAYGITQHHIFNVKVIATELLTFSIWIFVLARILVADTVQDQIINGALLFFLVVSGILLIRSVMQEVSQREKIEKLAKDLELANDRLKELDQLKSEFVSLATHQIRGPLTAIKGYISLMLEGDYGEVPQNLKEPIGVIAQSSQSLSVIVEDYLNVSRIEQGKMNYDFTVFDLNVLAGEVVNEMKPNIEKKGLTISLQVSPEPANIQADIGKIKQVIGNLVDNAVKYTPAVNVGDAQSAGQSPSPTSTAGYTPKGSIAVSLDLNKPDKKVTLKIKDTGVGVRPETIPHLFKKFSRAEDASKANILGTGLGLYVAHEMIKAHGGRVWVESEGEGKGATFFVELATV